MLLNNIKNKQAKIAVIGLGYVGLPLAVEIAKSGFITYGIDLIHEKINMLQSGISCVMDVPDIAVDSIVHRTFFPTTDYSVVKNCDAVIICVPTPLSEGKEPDVSYIKSVVSQLAVYMKPNTLISLESTTYPGTTEELIKDVLEEKRGFITGEDLYVCYSPERVDPGNERFNTKNTPKVVGGVTKNCLDMGVALYSEFIETVVPVSSTKVAETVKLLENTFRSVNIAFINELTIMCERLGINIWEVIDAAATKPFGFTPFYPGPGIGGHCIPLDPSYLSWKAKTVNHYNRFIELANDINANMPYYAVQQIGNILNEKGKSIKDSNILLIGMAYKKNIDDLRESPALEMYHLLEHKGAILSYHDPYVPKFSNGRYMVHSLPLTDSIIKEADMVVIATDHNSIDYHFILEKAALVYDTKNVTKQFVKENIVLLGGQKPNRVKEPLKLTMEVL